MKGGYDVGVGRVAALGNVLVDARGRTLYIYTPDRRGPSKCYGLCAIQWPPVLLARGAIAPTLGPGVKQGLVGAVRRANGSRQVTYNRWPLYTYRLDSGPGQASGEEDDMGLWVAMAPSGQGIR
jgi:predicted lipoprotein with Yx(FWY)xxD motif